jgi:hypothetical protein
VIGCEQDAAAAHVYGRASPGLIAVLLTQDLVPNFPLDRVTIRGPAIGSVWLQTHLRFLRMNNSFV